MSGSFFIGTLGLYFAIILNAYCNMFGFGLSATKQESSELIQGIFDTYSIEGIEFNSIELIVDKDYAIETNLFKQKWITNDMQDTVQFDMRGMTVFKKQEDSSWKIFRSIGQHNK